MKVRITDLPLLAALLSVALSVAPAPAPAADPVVAAVGDMACPSWAMTSATHCQQKAMSDMILARHPARLLTGGDQQYESGSLAEYRASYAPTYGRMNGVVCPVPGNHDYVTAAAAGFYGYFGTAAGAKGYRTCNLASAPNWTIMGLDSGPGLGCSSSSWQTRTSTTFSSCAQQVSDFDSQMARAPTCEIAFWHHPRWTASDSDDSPLVQPFLDVAYRRHVELVLNFHAHAYERFALQNPAGVADPNGFRMVIAGTGGVNLRPFTRTPRPTSQVRLLEFGALFITLGPASYSLRFVNKDGVTRDELVNVPCR